MKEFGYEYFDDPNGLGYRGYARDKELDGYSPWDDAVEFAQEMCVRSAVDVGCAKGFLVENLTKAGVKTIGFDVSAYALSFARGLPCFLWDIHRGLPVRADAVFALGVLCYVDPSQLGATLRLLRDSTKSYFLFSSYYAGEPQDVPDPLRTITKSSIWWQTAIEEAGFKFWARGRSFDIYSV